MWRPEATFRSCLQQKEVSNSVRFSRDGNSIYYVLSAGASTSVYTIPVLGGNPRKVVDLGSSAGELSPDEKHLALIKINGSASALCILRSDGSEERQIAFRRFPEVITEPAWSPNGKTIVYSVRSYQGGYSMSLEAIGMEGGAARRIGSGTWYSISSLNWLPEDRGLVAVAAVTGDKADSDPDLVHFFSRWPCPQDNK